MKRVMILAAAASLSLLSACQRQADVASYNLSQAADDFQINRRIVFFNGITDNYMLTMEGLCSINKDNKDNQLEVTCKTGANSYKKHFLGISDNVTYFAEQLEDIPVSTYHYKELFRPATIVPDVNADIGG